MLENFEQNYFDYPSLKGISVQSPLQEAIVCIEEINLLPKMPVDCYDINLTICNEIIGLPVECEIKVIMDL